VFMLISVCVAASPIVFSFRMCRDADDHFFDLRYFTAVQEQ